MCRRNGLPVFTFCNKLDRESLSPFELCDQIEAEFKLPTFAVTWPIGCGDRFRGVFDRLARRVTLFRKVASGSQAATESTMQLDDPRLKSLIEPELYDTLLEDVALLDEVSGTELDTAAIWAGKLTPVFFGSAANTFGVKTFLDTFLAYSAPPRPVKLAGGGGQSVDPAGANFSGFVFKLQANMDPRHRDKVAFVRVVSGEFKRGMTVTHGAWCITHFVSSPPPFP